MELINSEIRFKVSNDNCWTVSKIYRISRAEVYCKEGVLKSFINSQENTYVRDLSATLLKKKTLGQAFSLKFCEIFKNTFFTEHLRVIASEFNQCWIQDKLLLSFLCFYCLSFIRFSFEAPFRSSRPEEKVFWNYSANLLENIHVEVWFQ